MVGLEGADVLGREGEQQQDDVVEYDLQEYVEYDEGRREAFLLPVSKRTTSGMYW